ncbi:MAG: hypothetical protein IVW54_13515 [Candidatus Binataceae bacterium]|nr:hypothetical protein [Candidatus Binataceae bacterium]
MMKRAALIIAMLIAAPLYAQNPNGNLAAPVVTRTASAALNASSEIDLCDATAGAVTLTLPPASAQARVSVNKIDSSANACTIKAAGSDTMQGGLTTSVLATQGAAHTYVGNGGTVDEVF